MNVKRINHMRKVCSLYKNILRDIEAWYYFDRCKVRILSVQARKKFEENRCLIDECEIKRIVEHTEQLYIENMHWSPIYFPTSPNGVAYEREVLPPDWILDYWHPLEKAAYPKYFAKREERKKEYTKWYGQTYGATDKNC